MAVQVGILGFAHGHLERYLSEWKNDPSLGVVAVAGWDHNAERLEAAVKNHGIIACATPEELLSNPEVQAVIITAETSLHADLVVKAAAAGKPIVLQKPLALNMEQANRIVEAVNKYKVPFTMAWQMRVDAHNMLMKEMIDTQKLGKVLSVRRRHALSTHTWNGFENTWHNSPQYNRDIWADDTSHPVDWINSLFGVPETVTAEIMTLVNPKVPNDNGVILFKYANGPLVQVDCSFTCTSAASSTEIICERGTIIHNYGDGPSCNIPHTSGPCMQWYSIDTNSWTESDIPAPPEHGSRLGALAKPIADFLNGKGSPIATAEEARDSLRMVLATYVSNSEGRRVCINDPAIDAIK